MTRFARLVVRGRWAIIVAFLLLLFLCGRHALDLEVSFSILPLLESDAEVRAEVDRYVAELPPQVYDQLVTLERDRKLERADLLELDALRRRLEATPEIARVIGLADFEVVDPNGPLPRPRPFLDLAGDRDLLEVAAEHPLLLRRLLSADGRATALLVTADRRWPDHDLGLLGLLERRLPELLSPGWRLRFIGNEVSRRAMTRHMKSDLRTSLLFQALFFTLILPFIFRSLRGIAIPLAAVLGAELICLGGLAWFEHPLGLIDLAVPGIIMMIAICDSIHMIQRYEEDLAGGHQPVTMDDRHEAVVAMLRHVGFACFQTSLTTAIGFLSLAVARHQVVRSFGITAALAVMATFLVVLLLVPALLAVWPSRAAIRPRVPGIGLGCYGRRRPAFLGTALIFLVALFGIGRMTIDSHWLEELPEDEPIVHDLAWFERAFAGIMILDVRVDGDLSRIENLRALDRFEKAMLAEPDLGHGESLVDWIAEIAGNPATLSDVDLMRGLGFLQLVPERFPRHVVRPDLQAGRVVFRSHDEGTRRFFALRDRVTELGAELPPGLKVRVAGFLEMAHESSHLVATTMLESIGLSLLAISLLIGFIYRSWRIGLAAVIPNVMPILIALGVNGLFDIPVRIGIVMIYSLGLGLAVDDSIHLISRFLEERRSTGSSRGALEAALRSSGSALITTSVILAVGTVCYLPSGFRSLHDVGLLLTTIVVTALVFDLFLLPHLLEMAVPDDQGDGVAKPDEDRFSAASRRD
ncbi:MAG: MMPL family transporter [Planctomycetes bacterium]|nr:MMPL family transporter [Planctomycetota bacterium]